MPDSRTQPRKSVLIVEDSPPLARMYSEYLKDEDLELIQVGTGKDALAQLEARLPSVVLLDLNLPDMDGIEILKRVSAQALPTRVIVITAHGSVNTAVEAMRLGAHDFLLKPFVGNRLVVTLRNALEHQRLVQVVETIKEEFDRRSYYGFIGSSLAMQAVYHIIDAAGPSKATIFITGESGTGKEVCAEAVHQRSPRDEGAFRGDQLCRLAARLDRKRDLWPPEGRLHRCRGGQDRRGRTRQQRHTFPGRNLRDGCRTPGKTAALRPDRYLCPGRRHRSGIGRRAHRLRDQPGPRSGSQSRPFSRGSFLSPARGSCPFAALREREEDVGEIARTLLEKYAKEEKRRFSGFSPDAEAALFAYQWPGNVRELQNVIRNAVVLNDGELLTGAMLPPLLGVSKTPPEQAASPVGPGDTKGSVKPMWQIEQEAIEHALRVCNGNVPRAAALLEISPATVYRKRPAKKASTPEG